MLFSRQPEKLNATSEFPDNTPEYRQPVLSTECCLIVFDIHQDISWLKRILAKEKDRFSHLILGGDLFDPRQNGERLEADEACDYYLYLKNELGEAITFLLGNHDLPYLEYFGHQQEKREPKKLLHRCSGFSKERAEQIAQILDWSFWHQCRLFKFVNRYLVSHAGLAGAYWPNQENGGNPLEKLEEECRKALVKAHKETHPLFNCGFCRGGSAPKGGPCWYDFQHEFTDKEIPHPQLVGHTSSKRGPRQNGRSWCLDGRQNCYALLEQGGKLILRYDQEPDIKAWA